MNDSTLITMRKDVFELLFKLKKSADLQEQNIQSMKELVQQAQIPPFSVLKKGKLIKKGTQL